MLHHNERAAVHAGGTPVNAVGCSNPKSLSRPLLIAPQAIPEQPAVERPAPKQQVGEGLMNATVIVDEALREMREYEPESQQFGNNQLRPQHQQIGNAAAMADLPPRPATAEAYVAEREQRYNKWSATGGAGGASPGTVTGLDTFGYRTKQARARFDATFKDRQAIAIAEKQRVAKSPVAMTATAASSPVRTQFGGSVALRATLPTRSGPEDSMADFPYPYFARVGLSERDQAALKVGRMVLSAAGDSEAAVRTGSRFFLDRWLKHFDDKADSERIDMMDLEMLCKMEHEKLRQELRQNDTESVQSKVGSDLLAMTIPEGDEEEEEEDDDQDEELEDDEDEDNDDDCSEDEKAVRRAAREQKQQARAERAAQMSPSKQLAKQERARRAAKKRSVAMLRAAGLVTARPAHSHGQEVGGQDAAMFGGDGPGAAEDMSASKEESRSVRQLVPQRELAAIACDVIDQLCDRYSDVHPVLPELRDALFPCLFMDESRPATRRTLQPEPGPEVHFAQGDETGDGDMEEHKIGAAGEAGFGVDGDLYRISERDEKLASSTQSQRLTRSAGGSTHTYDDNNNNMAIGGIDGMASSSLHSAMMMSDSASQQSLGGKGSIQGTEQSELEEDDNPGAVPPYVKRRMWYEGLELLLNEAAQREMSLDKEKHALQRKLDSSIKHAGRLHQRLQLQAEKIRLGERKHDDVYEDLQKTREEMKKTNDLLEAERKAHLETHEAAKVRLDNTLSTERQIWSTKHTELERKFEASEAARKHAEAVLEKYTRATSLQKREWTEKLSRVEVSLRSANSEIQSLRSSYDDVREECASLTEAREAAEEKMKKAREAEARALAKLASMETRLRNSDVRSRVREMEEEHEREKRVWQEESAQQLAAVNEQHRKAVEEAQNTHENELAALRGQLEQLRAVATEAAFQGSSAKGGDGDALAGSTALKTLKAALSQKDKQLAEMRGKHSAAIKRLRELDKQVNKQKILLNFGRKGGPASAGSATPVAASDNSDSAAGDADAGEEGESGVQSQSHAAGDPTPESGQIDLELSDSIVGDAGAHDPGEADDFAAEWAHDMEDTSYLDEAEEIEESETLHQPWERLCMTLEEVRARFAHFLAARGAGGGSGGTGEGGVTSGSGPTAREREDAERQLMALQDQWSRCLVLADSMVTEERGKIREGQSRRREQRRRQASQGGSRSGRKGVPPVTEASTLLALNRTGMLLEDVLSGGAAGGRSRRGTSSRNRGSSHASGKRRGKSRHRRAATATDGDADACDDGEEARGDSGAVSGSRRKKTASRRGSRSRSAEPEHRTFSESAQAVEERGNKDEEDTFIKGSKEAVRGFDEDGDVSSGIDVSSSQKPENQAAVAAEADNAESQPIKDISATAGPEGDKDGNAGDQSATYARQDSENVTSHLSSQRSAENLSDSEPSQFTEADPAAEAILQASEMYQEALQREKQLLRENSGVKTQLSECAATLRKTVLRLRNTVLTGVDPEAEQMQLDHLVTALTEQLHALESPHQKMARALFRAQLVSRWKIAGRNSQHADDGDQTNEAGNNSTDPPSATDNDAVPESDDADKVEGETGEDGQHTERDTPGHGGESAATTSSTSAKDPQVAAADKEMRKILEKEIGNTARAYKLAGGWKTAIFLSDGTVDVNVDLKAWGLQDQVHILGTIRTYLIKELENANAAYRDRVEKIHSASAKWEKTAVELQEKMHTTETAFQAQEKVVSELKRQNKELTDRVSRMQVSASLERAAMMGHDVTDHADDIVKTHEAPASPAKQPGSPLAAALRKRASSRERADGRFGDDDDDDGEADLGDSASKLESGERATEVVTPLICKMLKPMLMHAPSSEQLTLDETHVLRSRGVDVAQVRQMTKDLLTQRVRRERKASFRLLRQASNSTGGSALEAAEKALSRLSVRDGSGSSGGADGGGKDGKRGDGDSANPCTRAFSEADKGDEPPPETVEAETMATILATRLEDIHHSFMEDEAALTAKRSGEEGSRTSELEDDESWVDTAKMQALLHAADLRLRWLVNSTCRTTSSILRICAGIDRLESPLHAVADTDGERDRGTATDILVVEDDVVVDGDDGQGGLTPVGPMDASTPAELADQITRALYLSRPGGGLAAVRPAPSADWRLGVNGSVDSADAMDPTMITHVREGFGAPEEVSMWEEGMKLAQRHVHGGGMVSNPSAAGFGPDDDLPIPRVARKRSSDLEEAMAMVSGTPSTARERQRQEKRKMQMRVVQQIAQQHPLTAGNAAAQFLKAKKNMRQKQALAARRKRDTPEARERAIKGEASMVIGGSAAAASSGPAVQRPDSRNQSLAAPQQQQQQQQQQPQQQPLPRDAVSVPNANSTQRQLTAAEATAATAAAGATTVGVGVGNGGEMAVAALGEPGVGLTMETSLASLNPTVDSGHEYETAAQQNPGGASMRGGAGAGRTVVVDGATDEDGMALTSSPLAAAHAANSTPMDVPEATADLIPPTSPLHPPGYQASGQAAVAARPYTSHGSPQKEFNGQQRQQQPQQQQQTPSIPPWSYLRGDPERLREVANDLDALSKRIEAGGAQREITTETLARCDQLLRAALGVVEYRVLFSSLPFDRSKDVSKLKDLVGVEACTVASNINRRILGHQAKAARLQVTLEKALRVLNRRKAAASAAAGNQGPQQEQQAARQLQQQQLKPLGAVGTTPLSRLRRPRSAPRQHTDVIGGTGRAAAVGLRQDKNGVGATRVLRMSSSSALL